MSSNAVSKTITLPRTGDRMPAIAYGTWTVWLSKPGEIYSGVKAALDAGYRHIDTAWVYDTEDEIGQAIADKIEEGAIKREDLFITTKIWDNYHSRERVKLNVERSLARLQTTYVDMVLVHWPTSFKDGDDNFPKDENGKIIYSTHDIVEDIWRGMEDCVDAGLTRNIGLSNFNSQQIQRIVDAARIPPTNLQIEINPNFTNDKLVEFAQSKNIVVSSYAPLGAPGRPWRDSTDPCAIEDPVIINIAKSKGKSPAQVIIRWHLQRGLAVCVKSVNPERIRSNIDVFDFELSEEEMASIKGLNRNFRLYLQDICIEHPEYPFNAPF
ncbi:aldose reductase-like [Pomacea canaliculata]|uniref:aldose reductase-like n=1 Tax=Pomacea canaliculata TaxID=400727 RepID=UPI000D72702A|nr:aldose reductase-like [Pomacea canaliculata]